ncbi:hypothetical protein COP1_026838 [Malus domestica]
MRRLWDSWVAGMLGMQASCLHKRCWLRKKSKTSSTAREDPFAAERLVIDMTSSNGKKNEAARSELVAPSMPRMASTFVDKIAQRKGYIMPQVPKSVQRRLFGAKSGSPLEMLTIMKSDKVDSAAKVAPMPTPYAVEIDSPAGKKKTVCMSSCEKSIKPASREAAEICVLLKPNMLEDMDACANKAANEVTKTMAAEAYFSVEEIKRLDSELVALKGSNMSAPTSLSFKILSF